MPIYLPNYMKEAARISGHARARASAKRNAVRLNTAKKIIGLGMGTAIGLAVVQKLKP